MQLNEKSIRVVKQERLLRGMAGASATGSVENSGLKKGKPNANDYPTLEVDIYIGNSYN